MAEPIGVRDDGTHEHGGEPGWSERMAFAFFDDAAGVGGIARLEFHPADRAAEGTFNFFVGDGAIATVLAREDTPGGGSTVGRIKLERFAPLEKWKVRCKDIALAFPGMSRGGTGGKRSGAALQVDTEVTFDAWSPPAGSVDRRSSVDDLGFVQVTSSGHFEQAGRYHGRLRVGGRASTIDGTGVRVRSWGARDRTASHSETWYAVAFGPKLALGVRAITLGARAMRHGWVLRGDEIRDVASLHVEDEDRGRGMRRGTIVVTDAAGERYEIETETLEVIPLREGAAKVRQEMTRFRYGDRDALGLVERTEAAARATGVPAAPTTIDTTAIEPPQPRA